MYKPICKQNQLILGEGDTAFITGWYPKKNLLKSLELHHIEYGVIGNLYSSQRGIDFLIRNLLANPQITRTFLLACTKEDENIKSVSCLWDFFQYGVSLKNDKWIINSATEGYIDTDIPLESLNKLRTTIEYPIYCDKNTMIRDITATNMYKLAPKAVREIEVYPKIETTEKTIVGELYGHRIEGKTIAEAWVKLLYLIRRQGKLNPTGYDGFWQELINLTVVVTDEPEAYHFTDYLPVDEEAIANYIPQLVDDCEYKDGVKYTYGQRLSSWFGKDQIKQVIEKLAQEKISASAVMNLWDSGSGNYKGDSIAKFGRNNGDSDHDHSGSPCLNHIWVRIIDDKLHLIATFRSNDMFSAWVSNAMGLRALQAHILAEVNAITDYNLSLGNLITNSFSAHIYDDCFENVDRLIETEYSKINTIKYADKTGNFLIEYDSKIVVKHYYGEKLIEVYEGFNPLNLIKQITLDNPEIEPFHIGYLGIELQKALAQKENYIQDK